MDFPNKGGEIFNEYISKTLLLKREKRKYVFANTYSNISATHHPFKLVNSFAHKSTIKTKTATIDIKYSQQVYPEKYKPLDTFVIILHLKNIHQSLKNRRRKSSVHAINIVQN